MMHTVVALVGMLLLLAPQATAQGTSAQRFPHQRHERLFPTCESCHAGIVTGNAQASMPSEASCRECHNGTDVARVEWRRPEPVRGLLRFSHPEHGRQVDSAGSSCATCHGAPPPGAPPPGARFMDVHRAAPPSCLGCHTHRATEHLADDNRCATCHVALVAATGLSTEQIGALPRPASHERADFATVHRTSNTLAQASCAVCHARESCSRCHVNASTEPTIASLGRDARVARLVANRPASYPVPADHRADDFSRTHGDLASSNVNRCGACHARPSCTTCHIGTGAASLIARIPLAERNGAQGVQLRLTPHRSRPPSAGYTTANALPSVSPQQQEQPAGVQSPVRPVSVHDASFRLNHKAAAATSTSTCAGCHDQRFCSDCHAGENTRRFHKANFVQRHAADSWGREAQCASCHNTELFCRSCHRESGLAARGRLDAAYHDAQPQWLLQHGRAARQGLQSCATCHAQRDCMTCHSTVGWGVSPHGPGFRPDRLASRNATQCLMCHLQVPGRR